MNENYYMKFRLIIFSKIILLICIVECEVPPQTNSTASFSKLDPTLITAFRRRLSKARNILVMTSSEISDDSGINTTDATGGSWGLNDSLREVQTFFKYPSLVWEYYNYRRELILEGKPNKAHFSITALEQSVEGTRKNFTILTATVDSYHLAAGSKNVVELFGSLLKTQCTKCLEVAVNTDRPICEALKDRGNPDFKNLLPPIPENLLPRCKNSSCGGLLRPYVHGVSGDFEDLKNLTYYVHLIDTDFCIIVGTDCMLHDVETLAFFVHFTNRPVAQFTSVKSPTEEFYPYFFHGKVSMTIPRILKF